MYVYTLGIDLTPRVDYQVQLSVHEPVKPFIDALRAELEGVAKVTDATRRGHVCYVHITQPTSEFFVSIKKCAICKVYKTVDNFYKQKTREHGFPYCHECERVRTRAYYLLISQANKRALSKKMGPVIKHSDVQHLAARTACECCGAPKDGTMDFTLTHKQPLDLGGKHDVNNLALVCLRCHKAKGESTMEEYMQWLMGIGSRFSGEVGMRRQINL